MATIDDYLGKELKSFEFSDPSRLLGANQDLPSGVYDAYRVADTGHGTRIISRRSEQEMADEAYTKNKGRYNEAIKPAVESYQATIPETAKRFQTERDRLSGESGRLAQRYDELINDIKNRGQQAENMQTRTTNAELARRGITGSSGVADQEITQAVLPIKENYTSQIKQTGLEREGGLAGIRDLIASLTGQETDAQRQITQAIANLQSGAGQSAITQGATDNQNRISNEMNRIQAQLNARIQDFNEKQADPNSPMNRAKMLALVSGVATDS